MSDRLEHIAGIIANLLAEAGKNLCPFQQEIKAKVGLGLMQWSYGRRESLEAFMWSNGIDKNQFIAEMNRHLDKGCADTSIHPTEFFNKVLDVQIKFMLHELTTTWEKFYFNFVDYPTNKTGEAGAKAYAELFCVLSLRPSQGGTNDNIQDLGVQKALKESDFGGKGVLGRINYSQLNVRRNNAVDVLKQLTTVQTTVQTTTQPSVQTNISGGTTIMQGTAMTRAQAIAKWPSNCDLTMVDLRTGNTFKIRGGPPKNYSHSDWMYKAKTDFDLHRRLNGRAWTARPGLIKEVGCIVSFHSFNHSIPVASNVYMIVSPTITRATERSNGAWVPGHHMCMHFIDSLSVMSNTDYNRKMNAAIYEGIKLVQALPGQESHPNMPLLTNGSKGTFVTEAQNLINKHGYTPALNSDGSFGNLTKAGVEWFQKQNKLTVNGMVTVETWKVLRGESVSTVVQVVNTTPLLKSGDKGTYVLEAQKAINKLGYAPTLDLDSSFGPKTKSGVDWVQKQHKLTVTGTVTPETWKVLRGQVTVLDKPDTDMPLLKNGDKGSFVNEAQMHINKAGYTPPLNVDGGFGPLTKAGVEWFQQRFGLAVSGTITEATWKMMRSDRNINTPDLKQGDKGDFVREIQKLINDAGYAPKLNIDGSFGALTKAGVEWVQSKNGLTVNGIVGYAVWCVLKGMPLLKQGDKNPSVGQAQGLINRLGYKPQLNVDNSFGALTKAGVEWVQKQSKLPITGTVTLDTWYILRSEEGNPI